ncbi:unnamed protein product [Ostreobium quekettii]|uniref:Peptidase S1 domain-containing protein n=1 Tax=Ostreobium quekettii TaxID=121088 RepID=A0A8S1JG54_9CHLO|nr:unnamed protein product [Ostreobium quekettii]|eukprot:evm.model.scf_42.7 EVM.evm.TU.scf_42.7   scf_42:53452-57911(-)
MGAPVTLVVIVGLATCLHLGVAEEPEQCDTSGISARIAAGDPAERGRWPWMVSLRHPLFTQHICGGTLVAADWVLTAAHCVDPVRGGTTAVTNPKAWINGLVLKEVTDFEEEIEVVETIPHPMFQNLDHDPFDVALLRLKTPSKVSPIVLAPGDSPIVEGDCLAVMGWGRVSPRGPFASQLQEALLDYVDQEVCDVETDPSTGMDCAGRGISATCSGDGGDPLVRVLGPGRDHQLGVSQKVNGDCGGLDKPSFFASLHNPEVRNFIFETMENS